MVPKNDVREREKMKEKYCTPSAELIEITLNDSIALGCSTLYKRISQFGFDNLYKWNVGDGDYEDSSNWSGITNTGEWLAVRLMTQGGTGSMSDQDPDTRDLISWNQGTCFSS